MNHDCAHIVGREKDHGNRHFPGLWDFEEENMLVEWIWEFWNETTLELHGWSLVWSSFGSVVFIVAS